MAASIAWGRANVASIIADDDTAQKIYQKGTTELADGDYSNAVDTFDDAYTAAMHALFNDKDDSSISEKERQTDILSIVIGVVIALILFWYFVRRPW